LALVLGFLAHQVDINAVAGGQATVALIGGDFHELAVVELVEPQRALLGGQQGAEQQQALRLTLPILDFRFRILHWLLHATSARGGSFRRWFLNPVLGGHKPAEDVAQVGALQARLLAVEQVQLRLRVQPPLALLGLADQHLEAGEHLLELGRGIGSAVEALLQQFGLGQVRSLTVKLQQAAVASELQGPYLAGHQGGPSALQALFLHP